MSLLSEQKNLLIMRIISIILLIAIFTADYFTGSIIDFGVVYLLPIILASNINFRYSIFISLTSVLLSSLSDFLLMQSEMSMIIYVWNILSHSVIFFIIVYSSSKLIQAKKHESDLARIDSLTGTMNSRGFHEKLNSEISRCSRSNKLITIAYMDIDNFKSVNDIFGHSAGDHLLCNTVITVNNHLRSSDSFARLGGDEFALLLPDTDKESAIDTIKRIQKYLLEEVEKKKWPVTFSIGLLFCSHYPVTADEIINGQFKSEVRIIEQ
jgi:diguanylate cyclase (GGDEF)-like protein